MTKLQSIWWRNISTYIDKIAKIRPWGTIVIDDTITCDGGNPHGSEDDKHIACYTHIHHDHIGGLEDSLGRTHSRVYATVETKTLSSALLKRDYEWIKDRKNYFGLEYNETKPDCDYEITFKKANHILGSGQLLVRKKNISVLYSSDFILSGTVTDIDAKYLILDATHGEHSTKQKFDEVLEGKNNIITKAKEIMDGRKKQLNIHASRGTLQRVMSWIRKEFDDDYPFLANEVDTNLANGYTISGHFCGKIENDDESFLKYFKNDHPYIRFLSSKIETVCELTEPSIPSIRIGSLSATSLENNSNMFIVNLKEHASVEEVRSYVKEIGPEHVIVDNSKRTQNPENATYLKKILENDGFTVSLSPEIHPLLIQNWFCKMTLEDFKKFGELFEKSLEDLSRNFGQDFYQKKWISEIENGKYKKLVLTSILNQKLCRSKFEMIQPHSDLKEEFSKISLISESKYNHSTLLEEFIETYFHISQKIKFDEKDFLTVCQILDEHISKEYFRKRYFYVPLYNFDSDFEKFGLEKFEIIKILPKYFDRISSTDMYDGDNEPFLDYSLKQLKFVLTFNVDAEPETSVYPYTIPLIFLSALRLTKSGSVNFGEPYGYHPLDWQAKNLFPGRKENQKYSNDTFFLIEENRNFLIENFQNLKKLHSDFTEEQIRYLEYSIRRFSYIYRDEIVEDNITDLMISLEAMLNYQPYEVSDKTSLRACMILEEDDERKRDCQKFIKSCYDIRSEIIHAKKRKAKVKEIKEILSDIEIDKILSNENIKKLLTPEEIDKISAKEFKKILSKEEIKQILPDEFKKILDDNEIKNRLESYVRKAISQILFLHLKYETQENVLRKIDLFTLNRSENPFD